MLIQQSGLFKFIYTGLIAFLLRLNCVNLALSGVLFYHNAAFDLQICLDLEIKKNNYNNFVFAILSERLKPVI